MAVISFPMPLREKLSALASSFTQDVLHAIRAASIEDLVGEAPGGARRAGRAPRASAPEAAPAPSPGPGRPRGRGGRRASGRLGRRSPADIAGVIDRIVALLRQSPHGLRAEQIRAKLGLQAKELPRPLREAFEAGRLGKSGEKRATTYFLKGAAAPAGPGGRSAGRVGRTAPVARAKRGAAKKKK